MEGVTGKLEKMQESKSLKDYEGKSLSQQITAISCCYTEPPKYDCEIFSDLHRYKEPTNPAYTFVEQEGDTDRFLVIGLSKGMIVFVRVDNLDHIYARFSIHQAAVLQIHELPECKTFLSICKENTLFIWGFDEEKRALEKYNKYDLCREVMTIIVSQHQQLLICFKKGDSELLVWDDEKRQLAKPAIRAYDPEQDEQAILEPDNSDEHEDAITCFDVLQSKGVYVTGDESGLVKIWNCKKQLVREVKFVEPINSVCFLGGERDIIVGHSGNLSRLDYVDYQPEQERRERSKMDKV